MDTGTWTLAIGGAIGLGLALFGAKVLVTGRAPAATGRSFRDIRDAGLYHLLFGLGMLLLVAGTQLPGSLTAVASAVVLAGVAVVRHRPRGKREALHQ